MRSFGPAFVLVTVATGGVAGCADIWGFQDPVDVRDGGTSDATSLRDAAQTAAGCRCIAPVPAGWNGPFEIADDTAAYDAATGCGTAYPMAVYTGVASPVASPATCTCTCGAPENACGAPAVRYFKDGSCMPSCGPDTQSLAGACTALDVGKCNGGAHFTIDAPVAVAGGSCKPSVSSLVPPLTWSTRSHLCASVSPPVVASCDGGEVCAAATDPAFRVATYCVIQAGMNPCPTAFPDRTLLYKVGPDDRSCTACACRAPAGVVCGGAKVSFSGQPGCGAVATTVTAPATCSPLSGMSSASFVDDTPTAGTCAATGGQPSGTATLTPTTVCCTP